MINIKEYYYKPILDEEEYLDDLNLFNRLIKNISRYKNGNSVDKQLIINQLIELFNTFQPKYAVIHLFEIINENHWSTIKSLISFICEKEMDFYILGEVHISDIDIDKDFYDMLKTDAIISKSLSIC